MFTDNGLFAWISLTALSRTYCMYTPSSRFEYDIIEFNPVFTVIVASHIRPRAMITVLHRDAEHRGEGRDDHRSRPDV